MTIRLLMQRIDQVCIEQAEKRWLLKPWLTAQCPQPGVGGGGRKEGEQELPLLELSLALNSCLGAGQHHPARAGEEGAGV